MCIRDRGVFGAVVHTHYAIVKLDNSRYFTDNDIDTFRPAFFDIDIQDGTLGSLPIVRTIPDISRLASLGNVDVTSPIAGQFLRVQSVDPATQLPTWHNTDIIASDLDNLPLRPESVLIGGDDGDFLFVERRGQVIRGSEIGGQVATGYDKDATNNWIIVNAIPNGLTTANDLYLIIDSNANDDELPAGIYLFDYAPEVVDAALQNRFVNIRPVDSNGFTGDALDFTRNESVIELTYQVYNETSRGVFALEDTRDGVDILRVEVDNDVIDFAHTPTVNGVPIGIGGLDYITGSNIPPLPADLDTTTTYTIRVTNRTATALPAANRITIDDFAILNDDITDLARGIPAGGTEYWSFTCLLYTSPSPRDS